MYSILPVSAVPVTAVKDYLAARNLRRTVIEWKYFDPYYSSQRERGYVLVRNSGIEGFLGLLPFRLSDPCEHVATAWSCDWFRNDSAPGIFAIMVIKESLRSYDVIYSLGGSEKTKAILPKLARSTFLKAAIKLDKPLRLSIFPKLAAKKAGLNFLDRLSGLVDVRLARSKAGDYQKSVISTGVSEQIKLVLSQTDTGEPFGSRYDSEYVTWQIGRCPEIVPFTCIVAGDAGSYAAILFWRHSESIDFWRLAIIGSSRVTITEVGTALDYVLDYITGLGGGLVSILVSHMQTELLRLLRTKGFIASRLTLPLFILARGQADNCGELAELSYLDTDLGYRFSLVTGD